MNHTSRCLSSRRRALAAVAFSLVVATRCPAAVVVISNRAPSALNVTAIADNGPSGTLALDPGDSRPLFAKSQLRVRLPGSDREYELEPNCAYYIGANSEGRELTLAAIGLGETPGRPWPPVSPVAALVDPSEVNEITVKILVDDDERRLQRVWEPELRQRIAEASEIMAAHGGVRLRVVAVGTWESNDLDNDFSRSLAEFERSVSPAPAQVAIGFTSQYVVAQGRIHMGGTRGPLHSHILLKERANRILDPERLELLVHELGHFQGASHSPEAESVMRPLLGQGLQRRVGAKVQFDPVNTLLLSLLGQEIRQRGVRKLADVTPETRRRMTEIYEALEPTLPEDPATGHYLRLINAANTGPLIKDTRQVLQQLVRVAKLEKEQRPPGLAGEDAGDRRLEFYVQQAALAARQVRQENGPRAFILAIGFALDDTGTLASLPVAGTLAKQLEGDMERRERVAAIGPATMRGRDDLAKHFFVSAHLVALAGSEAARTAGLVKELSDSNGGSGFSFRDMAADRAGVMFANAVLSGALSLNDVAALFAVESFMPAVDDLREDMSAGEFVRDFGGVGDPRLSAELSRIDRRIFNLPAYNVVPPAVQIK